MNDLVGPAASSLDSTALPRRLLTSPDVSNSYQKVIDQISAGWSTRDVLPALEVVSNSYQTMIDQISAGWSTHDVLAALDVSSSYQKMVDQISAGWSTSNLLADLDITASFRELVKPIALLVDPAQAEHELIRPCVEAIASVDEPGTVLGLEQALAQLICRSWLSSGRGRAGLLTGCGEAGPVLLRGVFDLGQRVWRRAVRLICAGWLPQDGLFGWNASAGLEADVTIPR